MSNHSLKSELELLKLPPVKRELATATPNAYQSYKNPDMARLEKSKEKYIPPHVEYGYKFTTKVKKKSAKHWKRRASHLKRQKKTDADMM